MLKGKVIADEATDVNGERVNLCEILGTFVFLDFGMFIGDTAIPMLLLSIKKVLLAAYLKDQTPDSSLRSEKRRFDISCLR